MNEFDANGKPLTASSFDYSAKGYDGFMGFGYDHKTGECCEDCICAEDCFEIEIPLIFWIWYEWKAPCEDLDTRTTFVDEYVGFDCEAPRIGRVNWLSGDVTTTGGYEQVQVILTDLELPQDENEFFEIKINAHWFKEMNQGCDGSFSVYIVSDKNPPDQDNTLLELHESTQVIQESCSTNRIATFQFNAHDAKWK